MALAEHLLTPHPGSRTKSFRIGRGLSSGRGKTSGKGTKGQRARTGGRKGLKWKGMKQMLLGFPKYNGFLSRFEKPFSLPLSALNRSSEGGHVDLLTLRQWGILPGRVHAVKIIGGGTLRKAVHVHGIAVTASVKQAIEARGGTLTIAKGNTRIK